MAGKTEAGPGAASPDLFMEARWVVVPAVRSSETAIAEVSALAESMGATPMIMDAAEHDAYVAAISHMPMLAATAMFSMVRASEAWPELSLLAAGGFKDMTRLTGTDAAMAFDIAVTNREHASHWIDRYIDALRDLKERLVDVEAEEGLFKLIAQNEFEYSAYRNGKVGREEVSTGAEVPSLSFQEMLTGGWVRDKLEEVTKGSEQRLAETEARRRERREV
jgi:prephenate dehydrogenase